MIDYRHISQAAERLREVAIRTPLIANADLDRMVGGKLLLKAECLQKTGSFKIRGAYNLMSQLSKTAASRGVVAWSSGNHAQGVASAGKLLGIQTAIVMPEDAPATKRANTRRYGGEIISYDRKTGDREAIAREVAGERGAELVPSYDHNDIICGQGTVGLEIGEQCEAGNCVPDQVLICCGGGGLTAGSAIALSHRFPDIKVHTVEPATFDDTARSLATNERTTIDDAAHSICDALQTATPGKLTFEINRRLVCSGLTVTDDEVRHAMRVAFKTLKLVVEPSGAVALAAVLAGKISTRGKTTAVVISGGNVDADLFASIQAEPN